MHTSMDITLCLLNIHIYLLTVYTIIPLQYFIQYLNFVQYSNVTEILTI